MLYNPHVHMEGTRLLLICLLWGTVLVNTVSAETVPCIQSREECQQNNISSISIINNIYRCCALGFSMTALGTRCLCIKTALIQNCSVGEAACYTALTVTIDDQGHMMCCPPGFGLQSQVTSVNGLTSARCMCTQSLFGSGGNNSQLQMWQRGMQTAMKRSMGQLARGMLTMAGHMNTMKQRMASVFRDIFRG